MNTVQILVTPEQAKTWLSSNTRNRPMSMPLAKEYADDMTAGRWMPTHQGIAFYDDGTLADGQTRLMAVTIANTSINMLVTFGIPSPSALCIDTHRKRTLSNQLAVSGELPWLAKNEAAVAHILMTGDTKKKNASSIGKIIDFCRPIEEAMMFAKERTTNSIRFITTAPVKAAIVTAWFYEDKTRLDEFCKCLISGIMQSKGDSAAILLRERLVAGGAAMQHTGTGRMEIMKLTMKAINLFCNQKDVTRITKPTEAIYRIPSNFKQTKATA